MIELAGTGTGEILIIPLASEIPAEVAASAKVELAGAGARSVSIYSCTTANVDRVDCLTQIIAARLIYFTGGSQNRLNDALKMTKALELIRARHAVDLHLAGTSAGTAVMSEVMLTGNPGVPDSTQTTAGFGFVKKMILDQHFLKRNRQARLQSAVLSHPELVGVGIDEATAILVNEDESFSVLGDSSVMIMDARRNKTSVENSLLNSGANFKF